MNASYAPHKQNRAELIDMTVPGFTGLNRGKKADDIGDTDLADCLNVVYDETGALETRPGTAKLLTTSLGGGILGMHPFYYGAGSLKQLLYASVDHQYRYDNAGGSISASSALSTDKRWEYATSKGKTYAVDGFGGLYSFTGSGSYTLVSATYKFVAIHFYKNRLYGYEANSSILRFSEAGDPNTFPTGNFIEINTDDGQVITGLSDDVDSLSIHKQESVWFITGEPLGAGANTTLGNLQLRKANSEVGTCAHRTIAKISRGIQIFGAADGIYIIQNYRSQNISPDLEPIFKVEMNPSHMDLCWGVYNRTEKKYLMGFPSLGSSICDKVIMLDLSRPGSAEYAIWDDMPGSCAVNFKFAEGRESTLIGHPTKGYVYQLFVGYSDISPGENGLATGADNADVISPAYTVNQNLILNPSLEVSLAAWTGTAIARTTGGNIGTYCLEITNSGGSSGATVSAPTAALTTYRLSFYLKGTGNGGSGGGAIGIDVSRGATVLVSTTVNPTDGSYQRFDYSFTTDAVAGLTVTLVISPIGSGSIVYVDNVLLEASVILGSYYDGDTADGGGFEFAWDGTPGNSKSNRIVPAQIYPTLTDTTKSWTFEVHTDAVVTILSGRGRGQKRNIVRNLATKICLETPWTVLPDATSVYTIGGYKSYGDTKIFDQKRPALDKKYKFLDLFTDSKGAYPVQIDVAFNYENLGDFTDGLSLDSGSMKWGMIDPDTGVRMKWGKAGKKWGGARRLHRRLDLGGDQAKQVQIRMGNDRANQPYRISKYVVTYKEKKNRPD